MAGVSTRAAACVALSLAGASCDRPEQSSESAGVPAVGLIWQVEGAGADLVIAGSVHLLRAEDHPLPKSYEEAYLGCRRIVFEMVEDDGDGDAMGAARLMLEAGTLPPGERLWSRLSDDDAASLRELAARRGLDPEMLAGYRPWMAALTLAMAEYERIGADAAFGVDSHFETRSHEDGKEVVGLESPAEQVAMFSGLQPEVEEALLAQTIEDALGGGTYAVDLIEAWRSGDADALEGLVFADVERFRAVYETLVWSRNRAWVDALIDLASDGEATFVLVGAGHLVGPGSLVELLRDRGLTVARLGTGAAEEAAGSP